MTRFNAENFYDVVRADLFNGVLSQGQVNGMNYIMREWRRRYLYDGDHRHLAYMLATTFHETAYTMLPISEYGSQSYLQSKEYWPYYGRGFVQLTWAANFEKAGNAVEEDLLGYPDLALRPDLAAIIMFDGMRDGWFTGLDLDQYFNEDLDDPINARRIINGTDKAEMIADYHGAFLYAIKSSLS